MHIFTNRLRSLTLTLAIVAVVGIPVTYQQPSRAQSDDSLSTESTSPSNWRVVELDEPGWRQNLTLWTMVTQSRVVATGTVLRNVCRKLPNGEVVTEYQVQLDEILKGNVLPSQVVAVKMPGGRFTESNGTILEARARRVRKMVNGKRYVLFLKQAPGNVGLMTLQGSQGLYEIPAGGSRVIHLGRSFLLPPADDGLEISMLMRQLREIVRGR